jgi:phosphoribosyl 1,2-cyclic phosphate phosphodiesterase
MKITFLGTGTSQGVPVIACECEVCKSLDFRNKRLRVSVHILSQNSSIIIDAGPDFRQQVLRESIKSLDAILLTHEHKDHTTGLDDIRAFNFKQGISMPIFASKEVHIQLKREFEYVFTEHKYPGIPQMDLREIHENQSFTAGNLKVEPILVMHHKLKVFGFRIGDFTYITDANFIAVEEIEKIKGSKIVVLNALQKGPHISHFTLEQAIEIAKKIGAEKTYFTHISHKLGLHAEVEKELPEGVFLAYDGLSVSLQQFEGVY